MDEYLYAEVPAPAGAPLLFVLHGTGGNEHDLLDLGRQMMPDAHVISPRGDVSEDGAPRFFRRLGMGVFDMPDLERATGKLTEFVRHHVERLQPALVAALGYSNGANVLASALFSAPQMIERAVLMHPLIPFEPPRQPALKGHHVLITAGRHDPIAPWGRTEALVSYFREQGAVVELAAHEGGHQLQRAELAAVSPFLSTKEKPGAERERRPVE